MPFPDYSNNPTSNTEIGDGLFIGPNMARNDVRPALQQLAADGRSLADDMQDLLNLKKGDPGGNVMAVGLFSILSAVVIPAGADIIQTSGFASLNDGGAALYAYDATIDAAYVTANPLTSVRSANGRGFRLYGDVIRAQQVGVFAGVNADQGAALNIALAYANVVELPAGTIWTKRAVIVPAGKTLRGRGRGKTTLRATSDFNRLTTGNCIILLAGSNAQCTDITVDANKVGLGMTSNDRINGVQADNGAVGCSRRRLAVQNCTGYGVYDAGAQNLATPPSSANDDIRTFNCQIHYEAQAAVGTTYNNCRASDGDGDIPCQSMFHPLLGSKKLAYNDCNGTGAASAGFDISANVNAMDDIQVSGVKIDLIGTGVAFSIPPLNQPVTGLRITGSRFKCSAGLGMLLNNTTGWMTASEAIGAPIGVESNNSTMFASACNFVAHSALMGIAAKGITAPNSQQFWLSGCRVIATGTTPLAIEGGVVIDSSTVLSPSGGSVTSAEVIDGSKGFKAMGTPPVSEAASLEIGYNGTVAFLQAIDRTGGGAVAKPIEFYSTPVRVYSGTTYALAATFDTAGLNLATGYALRVNGTQVVGAQGAALPANASDLATAIALVNAIKARMKATGGHGLVAD